MNLKRITLLLLVTLLIAWMIGEALLLRDERMAATAPPIPSVELSNATSFLESLPQSEQRGVPSRAPLATATPSSVSPTSLASSSRATITVTLSLAEKTYQHRLPEGASVESLMDAAQGAGEISYAAKRYSGLGMLVTSIDGKENDADGSDMYWILSVNGKKTTTGASTYLLRDGDVVTWTYEKNEYN